MNIMIEPLEKSTPSRTQSPTRSQLLAVVVIMLLISGCDSLLYVPDRGAPYSSCFDELGMRHMPLVASDRTSIYAWYAKAREPHLPTLAYFTGNAGNVAHRACLVRPYVERGYGVLILSYRGYGGSGGRPDEPGLYLDAEAALDYLADQAGVPTERTVLYGQSLGSAVAVEKGGATARGGTHPAGTIYLSTRRGAVHRLVRAASLRGPVQRPFRFDRQDRARR